MVPLKLYLINKKISDLLEVEVNALAWIFTGIITSFIVTLTYLNHGDYLKEKYNERLKEVKVEQVEIPVKEKVKPLVKETIKPLNQEEDRPIVLGIIVLILMWGGLWSGYIILNGCGPGCEGFLFILFGVTSYMTWFIVDKILL